MPQILKPRTRPHPALFAPVAPFALLVLLSFAAIVFAATRLPRVAARDLRDGEPITVSVRPEKIAIAGGIVRDWDLFAAGAHEAMVERIEAADRRPIPDLLPAELGHDAGIVGAALLVFDADRHDHSGGFSTTPPRR